jgi:hypothetical protein
VLTDIPMLPARKPYFAELCGKRTCIVCHFCRHALLSHMDLCRRYVSTTAMCVLIQSLALVSFLLSAGFDLSCALMVCLARACLHPAKSVGCMYSSLVSLLAFFH